MIYYCGGSFLACPTSEAEKSTHNAHLTFHWLFTMKKDSLLISFKPGYMLSVQLHRHTFLGKKSLHIFPKKQENNHINSSSFHFIFFTLLCRLSFDILCVTVAIANVAIAFQNVLICHNNIEKLLYFSVLSERRKQ